MRVYRSRIGVWTHETALPVDAQHTRAFAAATGDDHPLHTGGVLAPPLYAAVPIAVHIAGALEGLVDPGDIQWSLHGAQDLVFHGAIVPGMVLRTRAAPVGVHPWLTGTAVVIKTETHAGSSLLNEQHVTLFFRRRLEGASAGSRAPEHRTPAGAKAAARAAGQVISVTQAIAPDQAHRYAEVSGDRNPIHLDDDLARSVGLPGIIVHGMCTMAFAGRAVVAAVCQGDPTRLRRLAVRFARPVFPGQEVTTHIWPADQGAGVQHGRRACAFETVNPDGKAVLQDGLAEVEEAALREGIER